MDSPEYGIGPCATCGREFRTYATSDGWKVREHLERLTSHPAGGAPVCAGSGWPPATKEMTR